MKHRSAPKYGFEGLGGRIPAFRFCLDYLTREEPTEVYGQMRYSGVRALIWDYSTTTQELHFLACHCRVMGAPKQPNRIQLGTRRCSGNYTHIWSVFE